MDILKRRKPEDMTRTVLDMEIPGGKIPRGRPRIRWMDNIRRDVYETTWPRWIYDSRQECVVNDGGKGRHTIVYKTQGEKVRICCSLHFSCNCLLLTLQHGSHIVTPGRYAPPASGGVSVWPAQILCRQCRVGRCLCSCRSRSSRPCSCIR